MAIRPVLPVPAPPRCVSDSHRPLQTFPDPSLQSWQSCPRFLRNHGGKEGDKGSSQRPRGRTLDMEKIQPQDNLE